MADGAALVDVAALGSVCGAGNPISFACGDIFDGNNKEEKRMYANAISMMPRAMANNLAIARS